MMYDMLFVAQVVMLVKLSAQLGIVKTGVHD